MKKYFGKIEYFYQALNNISSPGTFESLINKVLIIDKVEKIYDTDRIKLKEHKSSLKVKVAVEDEDVVNNVICMHKHLLKLKMNCICMCVLVISQILLR